MTASFLQRAGFAFSDATLRKLSLDPLVIDGTSFRFDFTNPYSNPNADGAMVGGTLFKNLVDGAPDATYVAGGGETFSVLAGKKGLNSNPTGGTSGATFLNLGNGEYDMHTAASDHDHVLHVWAKPVTGQVNGSAVLGDRAQETSPYWGVTPDALQIQSGSNSPNADQPYALLRGPAGATSVGGVDPAGTYNNASHLFSASYAGATGTMSFYIDGVFRASGVYGNFNTHRMASRRSHGTLACTAAPAAGDTVTINGNVITFVAGGAAGAQVNIGADAITSSAALVAYINANSATLGATAERFVGNATLVVINSSKTALLTLAKAGANLTVGAPIAAKPMKLTAYMQGDIYCISQEDTTVSGRTIAQAVAAEYAGFRPRLTAIGK